MGLYSNKYVRRNIIVFEEEYQSFQSTHLQARTGESHRRLKEGLGRAELMFLEKVWWPAFHHFQHLHPEYEVNDFKDGKRYLDFAYIRQGIQICFEIDGYGPHLEKISRWQFSDQLERQNQLVIDDWKVNRFSFDQVNEHPRKCQQTVQLLIGKMLGDECNHTSLSAFEKEIIRFSLQKGDRITPGEIGQLLGLTDKPVRKLLTKLVEKRVLLPASGKKRVRSYRLSDEVRSPFR